MLEAFVVFGLLFAGWVISVYIHPYVKCEYCKGLGRHRGAVFTYAFRPCHHCSGTGQKQRWGAVVFGRGIRRRSSSRVQPPTA